MNARYEPALCGHGRYAFVCKICGKPGEGRVPLQRVHDGCRAELRRRADAKFRAKKRRISA